MIWSVILVHRNGGGVFPFRPHFFHPHFTPFSQAPGARRIPRQGPPHLPTRPPPPPPPHTRPVRLPPASDRAHAGPSVGGAAAGSFASGPRGGEKEKMMGKGAVAAGHEQVLASRLTGMRGMAFRGYHWLLLGFLLLGVVQIFLAGLGVFSLQDQTLGGAGGDTAFAPHRAFGFTMAGVALLILVLAVIARPGARAITGSVVLVVLTSLVRGLLAGLADHHAGYA